jgi:cytochrome P450
MARMTRMASMARMASISPQAPDAPAGIADPSLSLFQLLKPEVLADPYPLYRHLREDDPVHWDPFLHAWVVTRYADAVTVFSRCSAARTPSPEQLATLGLETLAPLAQVMVKQMLFLDPPAHGRLRGLASAAFTPRRVEAMRAHIADITEQLLDEAQARDARTGCAHTLDVIADLAYPLPAIVTAEWLGVPPADRDRLKMWSEDFAQVLGNFQHSPESAARTLRSLREMGDYFTAALRDHRLHPRDGLIGALAAAEIDGDRLGDEEIVANCIVILVGGQETTTNLIGNGLLALLRHPDQLARLRADFALLPSAVEELLRYESPIQHTARLAPEDLELGGKRITSRQAVIASIGAANRDPERFSDPDRLDVGRADNRHLAFAWSHHFCFGASLARIEGQVAFEALLRRLPELRLAPVPITWRNNLGLRGITALPVTW